MFEVLLGTVVLVASSCFGQTRLEDGLFCEACVALIRGLGVEYAVRGEVEDGRWMGQSPTGGSQVLLLPQQRLWPTDI